MKKKNIIRMILLQFGYTEIEVNTFWTGTSDGQYPNSLGYEVKATDKDGYGLEILCPDFHDAIQHIFYDVTGTDINGRVVHYIDEEVFKTLK